MAISPEHQPTVQITGDWGELQLRLLQPHRVLGSSRRLISRFRWCTRSAGRKFSDTGSNLGQRRPSAVDMVVSSYG